MTAERQPILPPEELASVVGAIELLSAMWSGRDELHLSPADESSIKLLADYLQLPLEELGSAAAVQVKEQIGDEVVLGLTVRPDPSSNESGSDKGVGGVRVEVGFRLRGKSAVRMWVSAQHAPSWLGRGGVDELNALLARAVTEEGEGEEDTVGTVLNAIEAVSEYLLTCDTAASPAQTQAQLQEPNAQKEATWVHRTWYYLPSLSTPSKRKDICDLASTSNPPLTGFLLAGKPGLIVIEFPLPTPTPPTSTTSSGGDRGGVSAEQTRAASLAMDAFWSTIKTTSWRDIPPSHKKISERLSEPCTPRSFSGFTDVTDDPEVERGAERGRKSDLSKLIRWLDAKGINGKWALERCLGVGSWDS